MGVRHHRNTHLRAAAHGGQVLVSSVTVDLVREALTAELTVRDLGIHQLKDIDGSERIWQLVHPDLPSDFGPLLSVVGAPTGRLAEDRLARRQPFVGRENELRQLRAGFESASTGDGALILLVGEPGIGKTALSDQLCRFVSAAGGLSLVGHCYEEGSFRPPYQPFVEVFATYLHGLNSEALQAELGSSAADLARIVPTLRERLQVSPPSPGDPEEDRWRLLQAATDLLRNASAKQALLVVLEDLHDADRGTLDLLLYLARNLHGARILVVGTYRDVEVDRAHPLSTALTELHRASQVERIHLRGLPTDEVQQLMAETSQQTIAQPFAELVHRQTEGNPLFVRETLRFVIDAGLAERRAGALGRVGDQSLAGRIPEGLRDAVGKRLSRLSEGTNRVLSMASVIGREFQLDVLSQVLALPDEGLEAAIEEASAAGIIEERSVVGTTITYRFCHAFFRQTLYDEIVAPRRIRLHQQVAHALEEVHAQRLEEHAAELAEHYAFSSNTVDLAKAVHFAELSAKSASDVFAYGEAARLLELALAVLDLADPEDQSKRCDLLLALGEALWPAGETQRVITRIAPDALSLSQALTDRARASRACGLALDAFWLQGATTAGELPEFRRWAEQARAHADAHSSERIKADHALAEVRVTQGRWQDVRELRLEALALARQLGDAEALFSSAFWVTLNSAPQHLDVRLRLAEESTAWSRQGVTGRTLGTFLWTSGMLLLANGERARAEEVWRQMEDVAERTHAATVRLHVPQSSALLAIVDGQLEKSLELLTRYVARADELGASVRGRISGLSRLISPALYLGRADVWLSALEDYNRLAGLGWAQSPSGVALRATCLARLARVEEGRELVTPVLDEAEAASAEDETPMTILVPLLHAAVLFEHRGAARVLSDQLACVAHLSITAWEFPTCLARQLGDAAVLLGDRSAARAYYAQALEAAGKIRFRPELALSHLQLAELMVEDADNAKRFEALDHLEIAIPEVIDMKMQPALGRAVALRESLAPAAALAPVRESTSDTLTVRERQIATLMAHGLSNREISEKLVITEGTVEVHVKHILGKLGFRSRAQVAGWFNRKGSA
jgi:DNA-binding CsgD family transcriptional regulator